MPTPRLVWLLLLSSSSRLSNMGATAKSLGSNKESGGTIRTLQSIDFLMEPIDDAPKANKKNKRKRIKGIGRGRDAHTDSSKSTPETEKPPAPPPAHPPVDGLSPQEPPDSVASPHRDKKNMKGNEKRTKGDKVHRDDHLPHPPPSKQEIRAKSATDGVDQDIMNIDIEENASSGGAHGDDDEGENQPPISSPHLVPKPSRVREQVINLGTTDQLIERQLPLAAFDYTITSTAVPNPLDYTILARSTKDFMAKLYHETYQVNDAVAYVALKIHSYTVLDISLVKYDVSIYFVNSGLVPTVAEVRQVAEEALATGTGYNDFYLEQLNISDSSVFATTTSVRFIGDPYQLAANNQLGSNFGMHRFYGGLGLLAVFLSATIGLLLFCTILTRSEETAASKELRGVRTNLEDNDDKDETKGVLDDDERSYEACVGVVARRSGYRTREFSEYPPLNFNGHAVGGVVRQPYIGYEDDLGSEDELVRIMGGMEEISHLEPGDEGGLRLAVKSKNNEGDNPRRGIGKGEALMSQEQYVKRFCPLHAALANEKGDNCHPTDEDTDIEEQGPREHAAPMDRKQSAEGFEDGITTSNVISAWKPIGTGTGDKGMDLRQEARASTVATAREVRVGGKRVGSSVASVLGAEKPDWPLREEKAESKDGMEYVAPFPCEGTDSTGEVIGRQVPAMSVDAQIVGEQEGVGTGIGGEQEGSETGGSLSPTDENAKLVACATPAPVEESTDSATGKRLTASAPNGESSEILHSLGITTDHLSPVVDVDVPGPAIPHPTPLMGGDAKDQTDREIICESPIAEDGQHPRQLTGVIRDTKIIKPQQASNQHGTTEQKVQLERSSLPTPPTNDETGGSNSTSQHNSDTRFPFRSMSPPTNKYSASRPSVRVHSNPRPGMSVTGPPTARNVTSARDAPTKRLDAHFKKPASCRQVDEETTEGGKPAWISRRLRSATLQGGEVYPGYSPKAKNVNAVAKRNSFKDHVAGGVVGEQGTHSPWQRNGLQSSTFVVKSKLPEGSAKAQTLIKGSTDRKPAWTSTHLKDGSSGPTRSWTKGEQAAGSHGSKGIDTEGSQASTNARAATFRGSGREEAHKVERIVMSQGGGARDATDGKAVDHSRDRKASRNPMSEHNKGASSPRLLAGSTADRTARKPGDSKSQGPSKAESGRHNVTRLAPASGSGNIDDSLNRARTSKRPTSLATLRDDDLKKVFRKVHRVEHAGPQQENQVTARSPSGPRHNAHADASNRLFPRDSEKGERNGGTTDSLQARNKTSSTRVSVFSNKAIGLDTTTPEWASKRLRPVSADDRSGTSLAKSIATETSEVSAADRGSAVPREPKDAKSFVDLITQDRCGAGAKTVKVFAADRGSALTREPKDAKSFVDITTQDRSGTSVAKAGSKTVEVSTADRSSSGPREPKGAKSFVDMTTQDRSGTSVAKAGSKTVEVSTADRSSSGSHEPKDAKSFVEKITQDRSGTSIAKAGIKTVETAAANRSCSGPGDPKDAKSTTQDHSGTSVTEEGATKIMEVSAANRSSPGPGDPRDLRSITQDRSGTSIAKADATETVEVAVADRVSIGNAKDAVDPSLDRVSKSPLPEKNKENAAITSPVPKISTVSAAKNHVGTRGISHTHLVMGYHRMTKSNSFDKRRNEPSVKSAVRETNSDDASQQGEQSCSGDSPTSNETSAKDTKATPPAPWRARCLAFTSLDDKQDQDEQHARAAAQSILSAVESESQHSENQTLLGLRLVDSYIVRAQSREEATNVKGESRKKDDAVGPNVDSDNGDDRTTKTDARIGDATVLSDSIAEDVRERVFGRSLATNITSPSDGKSAKSAEKKVWTLKCLNPATTRDDDFPIVAKANASGGPGFSSGIAPVGFQDQDENIKGRLVYASLEKGLTGPPAASNDTPSPSNEKPAWISMCLRPTLSKEDLREIENINSSNAKNQFQLEVPISVESEDMDTGSVCESDVTVKTGSTQQTRLMYAVDETKEAVHGLGKDHLAVKNEPKTNGDSRDRPTWLNVRSVKADQGSSGENRVPVEASVVIARGEEKAFAVSEEPRRTAGPNSKGPGKNESDGVESMPEWMLKFRLMGLQKG